MKKTKFMRAALLLLVLTLITSCFVGGTFAKYTTSTTGSDSARVAYWGFNDTASIKLDDLFKTSYDKNVEGKADVIAPGTTNNATFAFKFSGAEAAPEVAYTFGISTEGSTIADDIKNNTNIRWKLDNGTWGTWDDMIAAIEELSGNSTGIKTYNPGELPTSVKDNAAADVIHTVSWVWAFDDDTTTPIEGTDLDAKDTEMGNKATLDEVKLVITITATQID